MIPMFPEMITSLPQADIPIEKLQAFLLQGESQQVLFMEFENDIAIPEHSHQAQWGVVLAGEIELKIGEETHHLRKGDTYFIPNGAVHSARIKKGYKDITLFNQKDRYTIKK